jgi:hypothetical protein
MTERGAKSISPPSQKKARNVAEYLYQGATIMIALLVALSAVV